MGIINKLKLDFQMGGGTSSNSCNGNSGLKVGNIGGYAHISYATGAVQTGSVNCDQTSQASGASVQVGISLQQLEALQELNLLKKAKGAAVGAGKGFLKSKGIPI